MIKKYELFQIRGSYRLWDNPEISRENFEKYFASDDPMKAADMCYELLREAKISSIISRGEVCVEVRE